MAAFSESFSSRSFFRVSITACFAVVVFAGSLCAQDRQRPALMLQFGNPVTGAPFSAVRTLDYQPYDISSDTPFHAEEKIYRDSAGRTRSEIKYPNRLGTVDIIDFVAHVHYRWTAGDTIVSRYDVPAPSRPAREVSREGLDDKSPVVEGVPTRHSRTVRGSDDSDREVIESWYSPDLRLAMITIIDKPSVAKTTYRFTNLHRGEPDAALFTVPAGYMIDDRSKAPPPAETAKAAPAPTTHAASEPDAHTQTVAGQLQPPNTVMADAPQKSYEADPKFQKALANAKQGRQTLDERLENWKHASKVAKGQCAECLKEVLRLQMQVSAYKDAVTTAQQLEAISTQPGDKLYAMAHRGQALMHMNAGQPKPEQVAQAEAVFRQVLAQAPRSRQIVFDEGRVLAMLGRDDEAKGMFLRYVDMVPASDKLRVRAEHFSEDPHLATLPLAPPFRLVTSQGEELQLDEMQGKVVLLDFWATWCGPCKESLPEIQHIAKKFQGAPLVVISISGDSDDIAWKNFVDKNHMDWPQYRDANGSLRSAYGVSSIPRFFTIDTDGALQSIKVGSNADVEGDINKLVKRAQQTEKKRAQASDKGTGE